jgi:hypothetical protein
MRIDSTPQRIDADAAIMANRFNWTVLGVLSADRLTKLLSKLNVDASMAATTEGPTLEEANKILRAESDKVLISADAQHIFIDGFGSIPIDWPKYHAQMAELNQLEAGGLPN